MKHYPIISTDAPTEEERASWEATERRNQARREAENLHDPAILDYEPHITSDWRDHPPSCSCPLCEGDPDDYR